MPPITPISFDCRFTRSSKLPRSTQTQSPRISHLTLPRKPPTDMSAYSNLLTACLISTESNPKMRSPFSANPPYPRAHVQGVQPQPYHLPMALAMANLPFANARQSYSIISMKHVQNPSFVRLRSAVGRHVERRRRTLLFGGVRPRKQ